MPELVATAGVILAGGLARRMGGGHKALKQVGGQPVLRRLIDRLWPQVGALVLNVNEDAAAFAEFGLPVIADDLPGHPGPLAGVLAALEWAAANCRDTGWVVSVPGDAPFVPSDLVARLHETREAEGADLACAASGGRTHPVVGLWPVAIRGALRQALVDEGVRKIDRFTASYARVVVEWPVEPRDPFFNVNTPEDLTEAERLAGS